MPDSLMTRPHLWSLDEIERRIVGSPCMVIDVETSGLDWKTDYICGWVLGFGPRPEDSTYVPVRHAINNYVTPDKMIRLMKTAVRRNPTIKVVGFAMGFDLKFMAKAGLHFDEFHSPFEDAQINAFLLDELRRSFSLDACAREAGVTEKKGDNLYNHLARKFGGEPNRDQMGNFHKLPGDDFYAVDYALGDSQSTWELWKRQQRDLDDQDLRNIWDIECRCIRAITRMEYLGVRVDEEQLERVSKLVDRAIKRNSKGLPDDIRSPKQMVKLFTDRGHKGEWETTEKGNPSFTESWMADHPLGKIVLAQRKLTNLRDSFLNPMRERHLHNGRVHTTFNQTRGEEYGTITGRLSSSQPNLQQVPKRNPLMGPVFRSIFIPDDGMIFAEDDLNQCEPRLLAHYGEVEVLIDGYLSDPPIDAHSAVAIAGFGYDPKDSSIENKIKRGYGKTLNQALLTGAGNTKAAAMLGIPMQDALRIVNAYFKQMPEIKTLQNESSGVFRSRGYLTSLLGRRMRLDDIRFAYRATNRLLQTGNADMLKLMVARVDELLVAEKAQDRINLLLNIHDSLVFQFKPEGRKLHDRAIEIMKDFGPNGQSTYLMVPMEVESGEGPNWAVASYGDADVKRAFKELQG